MHADLVQSVIDRSGARALLDYGCGKQTLSGALSGVEYRGYDPALPGLDGPPAPADVVYCGDVMEHVEEQFTDAVLADVASMAGKAAIFTICCAEGNRILGDGKPAHRNVHPVEFWRGKLSAYGRLEEHEGIASKPEYRVVVWKGN
ncbi:hypothetical protein [Luteimonas saliphila]|uniref:hypothetical protein n=1 Tax=Luteimonas saliphila TaxID=2804919 RepID=UPI00192D844D|nr:hypothetical protein [Luteimonas saliphila]